MLRRMIAIGNWLPEDSRPALDAAIATARRKGVPPAQWDDVEVRRLITTGIDGSGAIGVLRIAVTSARMSSAVWCSSTASVCAMRGHRRE